MICWRQTPIKVSYDKLWKLLIDNKMKKSDLAKAAQLACVEFVNAAMKVNFLLQDRYMPYYKWSFRALRELVGTEEL